ncbi:MAG: hypothetical protein ACYTG0_06165 [Planctomycetota bacterium]|jgi:outer membrane lipoprotein-sorting protein
MTRERSDSFDVVDRALDELRAMPLPEGPSADVLSAVLEVDPECVEDARKDATLGRRKRIVRLTKIAAAAALFIAVCIGLSYLSGTPSVSLSLAEVIEALERAKTVTWTEVFIQRASTKDGKHAWLENLTSKCMYKAPGLQRTEQRDYRGQLREIRIVDFVNGHFLDLRPMEMKATLTHTARAPEKTRSRITDLVSQFHSWLEDETKPIEPLGRRTIDGREACGFRVRMESSPDWSADLWADVQTKRLVLVHNPGVDKYDPDKDPDSHNPPREDRYMYEALGGVLRDIVYDQELDDSLFSFDVPEGYDLKTERFPDPTEKDMIEWLRIEAQSLDDSFWEHPEWWDREQNSQMRYANKIALRGEKLNPQEDKIFRRSWNRYAGHPVRRFIALTADDSWHYVGGGVKLGDKDSIVCWYRLEGSKNYRVVYGDLSVRDVAPDDLPKVDAEQAGRKPR